MKASLTALGSPTCAENVEMASKLITQHLLTIEGRQYLGDKFRLCKPLDIVGIDDAYFQQSLADNFAEVVQYNRDNRCSHNINVGLVYTFCNSCHNMYSMRA